MRKPKIKREGVNETKHNLQCKKNYWMRKLKHLSSHRPEELGLTARRHAILFNEALSTYHFYEDLVLMEEEV